MLALSPIFGDFYVSRTTLLGASRCINLYPELAEKGQGKTVGTLYSVPGLVARVLDDSGPWRALHPMGNGGLFGVCGKDFRQISGTFSMQTLGRLSNSTGYVGMVNSGRQILIVDGNTAFGYDIAENRYEQIDLPFDFGSPLVCAYQDGFFLMNQAGTQQWWQSDNFDVFTWNGLNFSSKDGGPDPIVTMVDNQRSVWLLGSNTTEVWINNGDPGFAFRRLQGVFIQEGCAAPYSAKVVGESVMWLSKSLNGQGQVFQSKGYDAVRVSTHAIEREIQSYHNIADAIAFSYQMEGHLFYSLTFPSADVTWVYDLTTQLWHEEATFENGQYHQYPGVVAAPFKGSIVVGDSSNGNLYTMDLDAYTFNGTPKRWLRSWPQQTTNRLTLLRDTVDQLQIYMQTGVGAANVDQVRALQVTDFVRTLDDTNYVRVLSGPPPANMEGWIDPQVMLRWSTTGGREWSNEHWWSAGKIGEVSHEVIFRRLGSARDRVWELSGSDPMKVAIVGAYTDVTPGVS